jgi:hypothetical protein
MESLMLSDFWVWVDRMLMRRLGKKFASRHRALLALLTTARGSAEAAEAHTETAAAADAVAEDTQRRRMSGLPGAGMGSVTKRAKMGLQAAMLRAQQRTAAKATAAAAAAAAAAIAATTTAAAPTGSASAGPAPVAKALRSLPERVAELELTWSLEAAEVSLTMTGSYLDRVEVLEVLVTGVKGQGTLPARLGELERRAAYWDFLITGQYKSLRSCRPDSFNI